MSKGSQLPDKKTQPRVDPYVGLIIDKRFRIVQLVGTGGMGRVYRAMQAGLNRAVALKILDPPHGTGVSESLRQRFLAEASMTAKLHHPNTVTVIDYGATSDGIFYIAFEFLEGRTLAQVLSDNNALPWPRVLYIAQQIARSLRQAHSMGVVHRDLKPANVMLLDADSDADLVKVLDFGLVKAFANHQVLDLGKDVTQAGMLVGSPTYMSPEQGQSNQADPRSDLYALGVLMYESLTGSPPFHGSSPVEVILKHINFPVPPLHVPADFPILPAAVENLVMRCLAKEPDNRPASMDEFLGTLQALRVSSGALSSGLGKISSPRLPGIDGQQHLSSPPHPAQHLSASPYPALHLSASPYPALHLSASPHPAQHLSASQHPVQHLSASQHPAQHLSASQHPVQHLAASQHPAQHLSAAPYPAQHLSSAPHPAQHLSSAPHPVQHLSSAPYPVQHLSSAPYPAQHLSSAPHPAQHLSSAPHPVQHLSSAPYPAQHLSAAPHPAQHLSAAPHPAQHLSAAPHPAQHLSAAPHPAQHLSAAPHPAQHLSAAPHPAQHLSAAPYPVHFAASPNAAFVSEDTLTSPRPTQRATLSYGAPGAFAPLPEPSSARSMWVTRIIWITTLILCVSFGTFLWLRLQKSTKPSQVVDVLPPLVSQSSVQYKEPEEFFEHTIRSTPVGATVFLDDMEKGVTPLEVHLPMSQANHPFKLRLELEGFQTQEFQTLLGPELSPVERQLRSLPPSASGAARPSGVATPVEGKDIFVLDVSGEE